MKKFLLMCITIVLLLSLTACSKKTSDSNISSKDNGQSSQNSENSTTEGSKANNLPQIKEISFSKDILLTATAYTVTISANDPDGDPLTYKWQVNAGSVDNASVNPITWKTPSSPGSYQLTITVSDGRGGEAVAVQEVTVSVPSSGTGITPVKSFPSLKLLPPVIKQNPEAVHITLSPIEGESASIIPPTDIRVSYFFAGDTYINKIARGFISFDISGLAGKHVQVAELKLSQPYVGGDTSFMHLGPEQLLLYAVRWGDRPLVKDDYNLPGVKIVNITNFKEFSVTSEAGKDNKQLVEEIQKCINNGLNRFQLRMQFAHEVSDNDGEWDDIKYGLDKVLLKIVYK